MSILCSKSRIKHNHERHIFIAYTNKYLSCAWIKPSVANTSIIACAIALMRYFYRRVKKTATYDNKTKYIYKINTIFEIFNATL